MFYRYTYNSSIQHVIDFLKDCDYGIVNNGQVVSDPEEMDKVASDGKSHLLTPEEVEKYKCATCWDAANYIKAKLPEVDTYYIEIHDTEGNMLTHTFCVQENDEEALWIEGSWRPYVGKAISFDTLDDLFDFVTEHLVNDDKEISSDYTVKIYKYETYGNEKMSDEEFMNRCKSGELVRNYNNHKKESAMIRNIFTITEEILLPGTNVILEVGDKIRVITENYEKQ